MRLAKLEPEPEVAVAQVMMMEKKERKEVVCTCSRVPERVFCYHRPRCLPNLHSSSHVSLWACSRCFWCVW